MNKLSTRLGAALDLRPREHWQVGMLWLHSFFEGAAIAYFTLAAYLLFLHHFPVSQLPIAFLGAALVEIIVGVVSSRLEHSMKQSRMLTYFLLFILVATVTFRLGLFWGTSAWIVFGLMIWSRVIKFITHGEFWGLSALLFDVSQSKRLFSLIDSGAFLANIIAFFSVPPLTVMREGGPIVGVENLLWISAASLVISIYFLRRIVRRYKDYLNRTGHHSPTEHHDHFEHDTNDHALLHHQQHRASAEHATHTIAHEEHNPFKVLLKSRFLISVSMVATVSIIGMTCIDFGFLKEIEHKYGEHTSVEEAVTSATSAHVTESSAEQSESQHAPSDNDSHSRTGQIAFFLSLFMGISKGISFVFKTAFTGRFFNRYGLMISLAVLPVALFLLTATSLTISSIWGAPTIVMWLFVCNQLFVEIWSEAVHVPAMAVAFQPLTPKQRLEGHSVVQGTMEPIALGVAGLLLLGMITYGSLSLEALSVILLLVLLLWLAAIPLADKEYKETIKRALRHRSFEGRAVEWDEATRAVIEQKLHSTHSGEVIYALGLIPTSEHRFFAARAIHLLRHSSPDVQTYLLSRIEDFRYEPQERHVLLEGVRQLLASPGLPQRTLGQAIRAYCSLDEGLNIEEMAPWLEDVNPDVQKGVITGLIRYRGIDGILLAGQQLLRMLAEKDYAKRLTAAEIIGLVGVRNFYHPLLELVHDPNEEVRLAAVGAYGRVRHARLLDPLLEILDDPFSSRPPIEHAVDSLVAYGDEAVHAIRVRFASVVPTRIQYRRYSRLLGRIGGPLGQGMLIEWLDAEPPEESGRGSLRMIILDALNHTHYHTGTGHAESSIRARFDLLIEEELQMGEWLRDARRAMAIHQNGSSKESAVVLDRAFIWEIEQVCQRSLLLLAFTHDSTVVTRARDTILYGSAEHRANAFELLDNILPKPIAHRLVPLIEGTFERHVILPIAAGHSAASTASNELDTLRGLRPWPTMGEGWHTILDSLILDQEKSFDPWTRIAALYYVGEAKVKSLEPSLHTVERSLNAMVAETASVMLTVFDISPESALQLESIAAGGVPVQAVGLRVPGLQGVIRKESDHMSMTLERVMVLKTVELFRETPDNVLAHIATVLEEVHAHPGEEIIRKGELGNCLYIIVEGRVRIHDGAFTLTELGSRHIVGELSLLDPEPRSASVTAIEDSLLLRLDREPFYDIMADRIEVAKGALSVLSRRLRAQNDTLAKLKSALPTTE